MMIAAGEEDDGVRQLARSHRSIDRHMCALQGQLELDRRPAYVAAFIRARPAGRRTDMRSAQAAEHSLRENEQGIAQGSR